MTEEFADVAQLVEQLIRNQQVNGSSPFVGSTSLKLYLGASGQRSCGRARSYAGAVA